MTQPSLRLSQVRAAVARGNGVAALGDSITQGNAQVGTGLIGSSAWFVQSCMRSQGRMRYVRNAGISGNNTAQMLARIDADVLAFEPDWCFVLGGTNDIGQSVAQATIRTTLLTIYRRLVAENITPILCTLTPRSDTVPTAELDILNAWIRWIAQTHGYPLCDFEAVTMNPLTGGFRSGYSTDGLHPSQTGVTAMAGKVMADILPLFPQATPYTTRTNLTTGASILTLGNFLTDANTDGVADGWTGINTSTNATPSLVAEDGHVFGRWQKLVVTTTGTKFFDRDVLTGSQYWVVGDRLAFTGKVTTSGAIAGTLSISARMTFQGAGTNIFPVYQLINDVADWVWYQEVVIPASTTSITIDLLVNSGTGTVQWGEVAVVNMTKQGFV